MIHRIKKIQAALKNGEAFMIESKPNRLYLTGFSSSAGTLLITKETAEFFIDFRYFEKAAKTISHCKTTLQTNRMAQIQNFIDTNEIKNFYVESSSITLDAFISLKHCLKNAEIIEKSSLSDLLLKMRAEKSLKELSAIKEAQRITDETFSYILNRIRPGISEREIMLDMEFFLRKQGSDGIAFDFIVVGGKNSSLPHGSPGDYNIQKGDFVTMDFGAVYKGYCSDMTRTIAVGSASDRMREVYYTVLEAQNKAFEAIKPGAVCKSIDAAARNYIYDKGFNGCFGHGLGHSLGIEVHESPSFNTRDETLLEPGMVLSVEPGIYLENQFGVRIEDIVAITESSFDNLTHSPKELIIL